MPFSGVSPYTGPWGYHPGWGRGGNSLPVDKNHTGPSQSAPPRSGRCRGEIPGGAQARGAGPKHSFPQASTRTPPSSLPHPPALRAPPPPQAGAVQVISPERPARGGNPLPVDKNHTGPSPGPPHRIGISHGDSPGGAQAWEAIPYTALLSPHPSRRRPSCRPQGLIATRGDLPALREKTRSFKEDNTLHPIFPAKNQLRAHLWSDPGDL